MTLTGVIESVVQSDPMGVEARVTLSALLHAVDGSWGPLGRIEWDSPRDGHPQVGSLVTVDISIVEGP